MNPVSSNGTGDIQEDPAIIQERKECSEDLRWAWNNLELMTKYWHEYVAVYQKQVVAHGTDRAKLLDEAVRVTGAPRHRIMVVGMTI